MPLDKNTVLASFGQLNRHERFQIVTKIIQDEAKVFVRKEAYSKEAFDHIKSLSLNHKIIANAFKNKSGVRLVSITNTKQDQIDFEYISGQDLEQKVFKLILKHDYENASKYINRVFDIIDHLSSKRNKQEDEVVRKINDIYAGSSKNYISPGIIDLNLDNFFVDNKDKLVMFDYEWVFNSPVAIEFVVTRLLYVFFARRYDAIAQLPNDKHTFTLMDSGQDKVLIPNKLFSLYKKYLSKDSIKKYLQAEAIFQNYVTNNRVTNIGRVLYKYSTKLVSSPDPTFPERFESLQNRFNEQIAQITNLQTVINNQQEDISKLRTIISNIENSRLYKVVRKIQSVSKKLK